MVNIVQLWDFEDGTTQGWTLGDHSSLDDTSQIQGTYSIYYTADGVDYVIMSIDGLDLSSLTKPMLVFVYKDVGVNAHFIRIVIKQDTNSLLDASQRVWANETRIPIFDLSAAAGQSNITMEIHSYLPAGHQRKGYIDQIAIVDGADYEYSTGVMLFDNEQLSLDISVPTADGDLSSITVDRFAVSLATPDWNYTWMKATANTNTQSLSIDSGYNNIEHNNYVVPDTAPSSFQGLRLDANVSVGSYAYWTEKVAVMFMTGWTYQRLYLFDLIFTANGVSPRYANVVHTTTYGSTVSGSKDISFKAYGNSIEVALKARYIEGDSSMVQSGTMSLTVYSSDKSTNYGSVSLDLTAGDEQTTGYITGLPSNTDLILTYDWSITANARVVILAYPLVKIS